MSFDRQGKERHVTFECDRCHATHDTNTSVWSEAIANVRAEGWTAVRTGNGFEHFCDRCKK